MKYKVERIAPNVWNVIKEDGKEYKVVFNFRLKNFLCECKGYSLTRRWCKHIIFVVRSLISNQDEFEG